MGRVRVRPTTVRAKKMAPTVTFPEAEAPAKYQLCPPHTHTHTHTHSFPSKGESENEEKERGREGK